jgi:hypothetical protein
MALQLVEFNMIDNDITTNDRTIEVFAFVNEHLCRFGFNPGTGEYMWTPLGFNRKMPFLRDLNICTDPDYASMDDWVYNTLFQSFILSLNREGRPVLIPIKFGTSSYDVLNLNIEQKDVWRYVQDLMRLTMFEYDEHRYPDVREMFHEFEELTRTYSMGNKTLYYSKEDMDRHVAIEKRVKVRQPISPSESVASEAKTEEQ